MAQNHCCCDNTATAALENHLACMVALHNRGDEWYYGTTLNAAIHGDDLECLKYAHEHGAPWTRGVTHNLADSLQGLKYVHEHGCPWDDDTTLRLGHENVPLECMRFCHDNGCPWHPETIEYIIRGECVEKLRYAHSNGAPFKLSTGILLLVARAGLLDILKYVHDNCRDLVSWEESGL